MADSRRRDVQFLSRTRESTAPGGNLEGAQGVQRGQSDGRGITYD